MAQTAAPDLDRLIDDLATGRTVSSGRLSLLSEIAPADLDRLRERWADIPPDAREGLIEDITQLSNERLELNFDAFARLALADPEPEVRLKAIETVWESTSPDVGNALITLLMSDPEEVVRASAADALKPFVLAREFDDGDPALGERSISTLRSAFEDSSEALNVRAAALESVAVRSLPWVATLISDAYYDDDRDLRLSALRAMGISADIRWLDLLEEDLQSSDPDVRFEAVHAVGEIGEEEGVELVAPLLDDEDHEVVAAALNALASIAGPEAMDLLRRFADETEDPDLRAEAHAALDVAAILSGAFDDDADDPDGDPWDE